MDSIIQEVGGCGRFQMSHVTLTQACHFVAIWGLYLMMFGNYEPTWECVWNPRNRTSISSRSLIYVPTDISTNDTDALLMTNTSDDSTGIWDLSDYYDDIMRTDDDTHETTGSNVSRKFPKNKCDVPRPCDEVRFDPRSSTIVSQFGLICDKAWIQSLMIFVQMLGTVIGSYVGRQFRELFGAKKTLYGNVALFTLFNFLAEFSRYWEMYTAFLFFIGFNSGGILSTTPYSLEYLPVNWRSSVRLLPLWSISLSVYSLAVVVLKDWRYLHLLIAGLSGVTFIGVFWVTASIRWLVFHDYIKKADVIVWRIAETNNYPIPRSDILDAFSMEVGGEAHQVRSNSVCLNLCSNSDVRKLTLRISCLWLFTSLCYLVMGLGIKSLSGNFYINIILACVTEIPASLMVYPLLKRYGSHWTIAPCLMLSAVGCMLTSVYYYALSQQGVPIKVFVFIAKTFALASWYGISSSTLQFYPQSATNINADFFTIIFRTAGVLCPFLIPCDQITIGLSFAIMSCILWICVPVLMLVPTIDAASFPFTAFPSRFGHYESHL